MNDEKFLERLLAIRSDPKVRALARRYAGDPEAAEDALQEAFYAVARVRNPERIEDLRRYFCKVLIREANMLRGQLGATATDSDGLIVLADLSQRPSVAARGTVPAPVDVEAEVHGRLLAEGLLARLERERPGLRASVPGRSPDPGRYRELVVTAAEAVLRSIVEQDVSPDETALLKAGYPEWFSQGQAPSAANHFQRLSRARQDVHRVLRYVVADEPLPRPAQVPADDVSPAAQGVRTAGDKAVTALFLSSERTRLPHESPYDLSQGLELLTAWLDSQDPARAGEPELPGPAMCHHAEAEPPRTCVRSTC